MAQGVDIEAIIRDNPIDDTEFSAEAIAEISAENLRELQELDATLREQYGITDGVADTIASTSGMQHYHGLDIGIENDKDSIRTGKNWQAKMAADYGYIRGTVGADGDQVDCFVGPEPYSKAVFVVNQHKQHSGDFDEHKVMLGYLDGNEAIADYKSSYDDGEGRMMSLEPMHMDDFKQWLKTGDMSKPCGEEE